MFWSASDDAVKSRLLRSTAVGGPNGRPSLPLPNLRCQRLKREAHRAAGVLKMGYHGWDGDEETGVPQED
jgi:hypothetical protein